MVQPFCASPLCREPELAVRSKTPWLKLALASETSPASETARPLTEQQADNRPSVLFLMLLFERGKGHTPLKTVIMFQVMKTVIIFVFKLFHYAAQ